VDPLDSIESAPPTLAAPPGAGMQAGTGGDYSLLEVARHLQVSPDTLRAWNARFGAFLPSDVDGDMPRYTSADVAVLLTIRSLQEQGQSDAQIQASLMPRRLTPPADATQGPLNRSLESARNTAVALASQWQEEGTDAEAGEGTTAITHALGDVFSALANSQQTVLNSQASVREMVSVVVQDNFNLKDENRKLRDRMLELERALAEYQRREETRKERYEARMRALEGTVAALQHQVAQLVQLQRAAQQKKRGGWW
jgi:DNA-binding transcriptional MerR regulator